MKKRIILSIIAVFLAIFTAVMVQALPANSYISSNDEITIWTKAICNDNGYCIDVQVVCEGSKLVGMKPIPGPIYHSEDWEDPRPTSLKAKWSG